MINNIAALYGSATIKFNDNSTAGTATINNAGFGRVEFNNHSSADNATIVNSADGSFGGVAFFNHSTAGNAFITTNFGALTLFFDHADGGTARFETALGGTVDFSGSIGPNSDGRINVGSIAGLGTYVIGPGNTLVVGGNNLSTEMGGALVDGCGCLPGSLEKVGTGTLILSGTNTYTGTTTVNDGKLIVNGSIVTSSGVTVNTGGTLGGNGFVPTTVIKDGGTLSPGNSIGVITVVGDISFVGAGNYLVEVSPATADLTNASGFGTLSGTVRAHFAIGAYAQGSTYLILSAAAGLGGTTFNTLTTDAPALGAKLEYAPNGTDVLLTLNINFGQVTGLNVNQKSVATSLQSALNQTGTLPVPLLTIASFPGPLLQNALTQLSGEIGTGAPTAAFQTIDQFLNLMLDPFLQTQFGNGTTQERALSFAPTSSVQARLPGELLSYELDDYQGAAHGRAGSALDRVGRRLWGGGPVHRRCRDRQQHAQDQQRQLRGRCRLPRLAGHRARRRGVGRQLQLRA